MKTINNAEYIKEHVTMPEVISKYHHLGRHRGRTSCPIHGGTGDNLGYDDRVFHCFVCGAKGDVISFVMQLNRCDYNTAVRILDSDFGLGLSSMSEAEREEAAKRERLRREAMVAEREQIRRNNEAFRVFAKYKRELSDRDDFGSNPIAVYQHAWCDRQLDFIMDGGNYKDDPLAAVETARGAVNQYYEKRGGRSG